MDDWKLILTAGKKPQLYNIHNDPQERNNLYMQHPEKVQELSKLMKEQIFSNNNKSIAWKRKTRYVPITSEQHERLRALGYLD